MSGKKFDLSQCRRYEEQQKKARRSGKQSGSEDPFFIAGLLQPVPDDRIGDPNGSDWNDQIAGLN